MTEFKKILIANRGEIAIRIMRAANEMGKKTVAVFAEEDKLGLHRFKADEAYRIGEGMGPVAAYLSIDEIIRVAKMSGADAIHPGYGLLSENPDFVDACTSHKSITCPTIIASNKEDMLYKYFPILKKYIPNCHEIIHEGWQSKKDAKITSSKIIKLLINKTI